MSIEGIEVARLGSARLGSARLGSARLGSARLGSARLQCGLYHNLAPNARIVALGALLILLQACGGGGGGGSSMPDCMDAAMPFSHNGMCVAACPPNASVSHNGACLATCPNAAPVSNNDVCEEADDASECPAERPEFDEDSDGNCRPRRESDCIGQQTFANGECSDPDCAAPRIIDEGVCTDPPITCTDPMPFLHDGRCVVACPNTASVSHNGACRETCPTTAPVSHDGVCVAMCPDAEPESSPDDVCRRRESTDCGGTTPIFTADRTCVAATDDADCFNMNTERPIHVDTGADEGACRPAELIDCKGQETVDNGMCIDPDCDEGETVDDGGFCAGACEIGETRIAGVCTSPGLTSPATITPAQTNNYNALSDVGGNLAFFAGTSPDWTGITHGRNSETVVNSFGNPEEITADGVELVQGAAGSGFTSLTITRGRAGTGYIWTAATNSRTRRTEAPDITVTETDRRAHPSIPDNAGRRIGGGINWSYPTIALNAADLLGDAASNADDETAGDATEHELNVRAAVVEWNDGSYYMAGGVWAYDTAEPRTPTSEIVGAFAYGDFTDITPVTDPDTGAMNSNPGNPLPTDGSSPTYSGHTFGTYATIPAAGDEDNREGNRGFFAAGITVSPRFDAFTSVNVSMSGFQFSGRGRDALGFTAAGQSLLENALDVRVGLSIATSNTNRFMENLTGRSSSRVRLNFPGTDVTFGLSGRWAGAFFGQGGDAGDAVAPPGFAGTWSASGQTGTNHGSGDFGISFVGVFGTRRGVPVPFGTDFAGLADPNHDRYTLVAGHEPLFAAGAVADSSVTQGSFDMSDTTDDRVYLALTSSAVREDTGVSIDVGNDVGENPTVTDLVSTDSISTDHDTATDDGDRRTGDGLGESGGASADDPEWAYTTHRFTRGEGNDGADEFEAHLVDWASNSDGSYVSGGVWSRYVGATDPTDPTEPTHQVGAFVDGETPTGAGAVTAATGEAFYFGHAYGRYSLNDGITGDANPGFFAARVQLNANFGAADDGGAMAGGSISGFIHGFLFSRDNTFAENRESELEDAIGGLARFQVNLGEVTISGNEVSGSATSNEILLPTGEFIDLAGEWGARFYGAGSAGDDGNAPQLVGGTFGVTGATGTDTNDVSFSIIGAFGAKPE